MTAVPPLTPAEHVTAATMYLARAGDYSQTPEGLAAEAATIGRAQVHATLATIHPEPDSGAAPTRPAPEPAPPPRILTLEDVAGDRWTLEAGNDGATAVLACDDLGIFLILDDPADLDRLAAALHGHAHRIRQELTP